MFELATPWAFLLLPLPWIIWRLAPRITHENGPALQVPFFAMLMQIHQTPSIKETRAPLWLIFTWILLISALSGPRWIGAPQPLTREGHNIMLALDISGSMAIDDMVLQGHRSTRLEVVKHAAETFVNHRTGDKIGLILFGTRAYLQTPLTYDKHHILLRLIDASVGLAGQSTALGDPIGLAVKHLQHAPPKGRLIILLTDGMSNSGVISPQKAAELAKASDIKIYTIGLGTDAALLNPLFTMMGGAADLDEKTLKEIAKITHGRYFRATDESSLQHIYALINQIETVTQEQANIRPQHDYYPWPLGFALCLFFIGLLLETHLLKNLRTSSPRTSSRASLGMMWGINNLLESIRMRFK